MLHAAHDLNVPAYAHAIVTAERDRQCVQGGTGLTLTAELLIGAASVPATAGTAKALNPAPEAPSSSVRRRAEVDRALRGNGGGVHSTQLMSRPCLSRDREVDGSRPEAGVCSQPGSDFTGSEGGVLRGALDDDADRGVALGVADIQYRPLGIEGVCLAPLAQRHQNGP